MRATRAAGLIAVLMMLLVLVTPAGATSSGFDIEATERQAATTFIDREDYFALLGIDWQSPYAVRASLELTRDDLRFTEVRTN